MLIPINVWFDHAAAALPEDRGFKLDLIRRGVEELRNLEAEFGRLPAPTPANINYALGKILHDVNVASREPARENWARQVRRRIGDLREALKIEEAA